MRALVVDDSRAIRQIVGRVLREIGFQITEAAHGREALERLRAETPDIMLVDWNMPEMSGIDLVAAVRSDHALDGVRIMMVTTETEQAQVDRALAAGANEYLTKPFTKDTVVQKLRTLGMAV